MRRSTYIAVVVSIGLGLILLANRHWEQFGLSYSWLVPMNFISFLYLVGLLIMAYSNKPFNYRKTNKLNVSVVIPLFNEDPKAFLLVLESLARQTLQPSMIHIVDDGSDTKDCQKVFRKWHKDNIHIKAKYTYNKVNMGKREVQAIAFRADKKADIFATIDSDTILDKRAIKNGVRPFGEPKVMSVAGLLVGLNDTQNLLTRMVDLGFVSSFVNGRAAWSRLRSVAVNCGGLAFYRASIVNKHLDEYLSQTVFGQKATTGDDRMLTNLALLEGWTVFQETSIGYTVLPENFSHLVRQRIRWWRSFFWGGVWLIRRFSPTRIVWWLVTWQFISFIFYTIVLLTIITSSTKYGIIPWGFILYLTIGLSYLRSARYLLLDIPKRKNKNKFIAFALSPISTALHFFLCSVLQYVGLFTIFNTGWGTRNEVEVKLT